jgi:hypothetical protein
MFAQDMCCGHTLISQPADLVRTLVERSSLLQMHSVEWIYVKDIYPMLHPVHSSETDKLRTVEQDMLLEIQDRNLP